MSTARAPRAAETEHLTGVLDRERARFARDPGAARKLVGTIDAVLTQLCIRYKLRPLTTDANFAPIAEHEPLERWTP